ncbi:N-acetylglucosamine-6-phosphate deacetylase [Cyclobacterium plantarum]|uniref:N-acetylglucosamine-6-phosphate deacetylase n=1 Tax=Cyclobacterium plantarum TaxID=2716263 RepID=A0ABX0H818_9BACT|nr:N-acetylglucosamine-6-phosphate deacetylase [Cyclobacterium plantarum]NHE56347.1 N-acetylglucosamine-6-phosphate deacetylase [Cyclobacterium plantarum]
MNTGLTQIVNGNVITPHEIVFNAAVLIKDGRIEEICRDNKTIEQAMIIDARGQYLSPGFIDIHVHGGAGHDFMDAELEGFHEISRLHARHGTTAMVPTSLTSEKDQLIGLLKVYEAAVQSHSDGAAFLGLHLEGPYFAMNQRGAQDPRYIRDPDPVEYEEILEHAHLIARWSAAPERKGALDFGRRLRDKGVLAAMAHTDAVYEEVLAAVEAGYTLSTHLYSGMSGVSRKNAFRFAGVIESSLLLDEIDVEIIADGVHLPAPLLKLIYKIKGPEKIALITDAMRGAGMPEGESILGHKNDGLKVIIEDDVAKLPDRSSFAGSVATADRLVRNMVKMADVPLLEAVNMMSRTPARIMGCQNKKGAILKGMDADLVLFDRDIQVSFTMVKGKIVHGAA